MSSIFIAVIFPSRGLVFSQTADELLQNLKFIPHKVFFSHRKPIPECFETPTQEALKDPRVTHLWFVEDDMVLLADTLNRLLDYDVAVVTCDYPVMKNTKGAVFKVGREVIFGGTGCTLVKREVFNELKTPYFRSDIVWNIKNYGDFIKFTATPRTDTGYGLHDVNFFINLYRQGIPAHVADFTLAQRKLKALGKAGTNNGQHNIEIWRKFKKDYFLKQVRQWPIEQTGNLTSVITPTGEVFCTPEHAEKLLNAGLATKPPKKAVVIDDSEVNKI